MTNGFSYIQVIPLFTAEHAAVYRYFREHQNLLDAMTGPDLAVVLPKPLVNGDGREAWEAPDTVRYPGLRHGDIPCLWIEDPDYHFRLELPRTGEEISRLFALLTDCSKTARSARELETEIMRQTKKGASTNSPNAGKLWWVGLFFLLIFTVIYLTARCLAREMNIAAALSMLAAVYVGVIIIGAQAMRAAGIFGDATYLKSVQLAIGLQWNLIKDVGAAMKRGAASIANWRSKRTRNNG